MQKKRIVLLFPRTGLEALMPQTPLSLLTLCPYLEEAGYEPVVIDTRVEPDYEQKMRDLIPDALFVGITSMTGHQVRFALNLSALVRNIAPKTKIVWGGIHASMLPAQTMADPRVDIVAEREGEQTIVELANCLSAGGDLGTVPGIYYRKDGKVAFTGRRPLMNLKELRVPSWHLIDVSRYSEIGVQTGRGCPWGCTFCYNHNFNDRRWRYKDADTVVAELRLLEEKHRVDHVTFYDDNFFTSPRRVRQLCEKMVAERLNIRWSTTCRADDMTKFSEDFIRLLKASGLHILFVGSESGSERILAKVEKGITVDDIRGMARITRQHDLRVHTSFMMGFPGETDEDRNKTFTMMDNLKRINPNIYITQICIYTPFPGTPLYAEAVASGFAEPATLEEWGTLTYFECNLPWLKKKERAALENLSFITRFVFWYREIKERYIKFYHYPLYLFLRVAALVRWHLRWFTPAPEWAAFRFFVQRVRG